MQNRTNRLRQLDLEILEGRDLPSSSLSGIVFADTNNNGTPDTGELGLAGAKVQLTGTDSQHHFVSKTVTTNANGLFTFSNLSAGNYSITEVPPSGYIDGQTSAGSQGGTAAVGSVSNIQLANRETASGYDLGELSKAAGWTSISGNFNDASVRSGRTLWFSSGLQVSGLGSTPVTIQFTNQTISYVVDGSTVTVKVPDSVVTFSPTATTAMTSFDTTTNTWNTTLPSSFSGDGFLGGVEVPLTSRLPGGISSVTWQGQFSSNTSGVTVKWQWAAAAYQHLSTDYNALNVKPIDGRHLSAYDNSDLAGTPEAFKKDVVPGARGDGGHDYTGSFTPPATVAPPIPPPPPPPPPQGASLSGFAINATGGAGIGGMTIELEDPSGNILNTFTTNPDGSFSFTGLTPGTYQLVAVTAGNLIGVGETAGTVNGKQDGTDLGNLTIGSIVLADGNAGINYDFNFSGGG